MRALILSITAYTVVVSDTAKLGSVFSKYRVSITDRSDTNVNVGTDTMDQYFGSIPPPLINNLMCVQQTSTEYTTSSLIYPSISTVTVCNDALYQ